MRIDRTRISRAHNLTQQNECWIGELVFFQNRIERNIFTLVTELAVRNVEHDSVIDLCPVGIVWQEDKLRISIDEFLDKPWASHAIHFNFLAGDPFHELDFVSWQPGSGTRLSPLFFTARIKSLHASQPNASGMVSVVLLWRPPQHCRS